MLSRVVAAAAARGPPTAKPGCPEPHRVLVDRHLARLHHRNPSYLLPLETGEIFQSLDAAKARVRAYAFIKGFKASLEGGGSVGKPGLRFRYLHFSEKTRNYRGLEDHVERDEEGNITSNRKREGTNVT
jgi:hypothetical protein